MLAQLSKLNRLTVSKKETAERNAFSRLRVWHAEQGCCQMKPVAAA